LGVIAWTSGAKPRVRQSRFDQQASHYFTANETFDVGWDTCSPVYASPFGFTGRILRVMVISDGDQRS
jgi:hypothetical protein